MTGRNWVGMMVVMPSLSTGRQSYPQIVARVVIRGESLFTPQVRDGIDHPGDVESDRYSLQSPFIGLLQIVSIRGNEENCAILLRNNRMVAFFGVWRSRGREFQRKHWRDLLPCRSKLIIERRFHNVAERPWLNL
jgi:hypothetical protein